MIEVAGEDVDGQEATPFQLVQDGEKGVAVFATRQADQPTGIAFDHSVLFDRFAGVAHDALAEFLELCRRGRTVEQRVDVCVVVEHGMALARVAQFSKWKVLKWSDCGHAT